VIAQMWLALSLCCYKSNQSNLVASYGTRTLHNVALKRTLEGLRRKIVTPQSHSGKMSSSYEQSISYAISSEKGEYRWVQTVTPQSHIWKMSSLH